MSKKFYFTNQTADRQNAREVELKIERNTGLILENPFYDGDAKEVRELDATGKSDLHESEIVGTDLKKIRESDGIIWYFSKPEEIHIGSSMEAAICAFSWGKPVYLISEHEKIRNHPWVKYFGIKSFATPYEFIQYANVNF